MYTLVAIPSVCLKLVSGGQEISGCDVKPLPVMCDSWRRMWRLQGRAGGGADGYEAERESERGRER